MHARKVFYLSLTYIPSPLCVCVCACVFSQKKTASLPLTDRYSDLVAKKQNKTKQKFPDLHEMCLAPASYLKLLWVCLCPKGRHSTSDLPLRVHFNVPPGQNHLRLARCQRYKLPAMAGCRATDLLAEVHAVEEYSGTEAQFNSHTPLLNVYS